VEEVTVDAVTGGKLTLAVTASAASFSFTPTMNPTNRRDFIKSSAIGTAGFTIGAMGFSAKSYAAISGANDRINYAVIGLRNQGTVHLSSLCSLKDSHNVQLRALCDTDEALFPAASKLVDEKSGQRPTTNWDLRAILDDRACARHDLGVPGRQARLCGEARVA
jgi:hypothetical protein